MTQEITLDTIDGLKAATREAMKKNGLIWESEPHFHPVRSSDSPGGTIDIIDGRMISTENSNHTACVDPSSEERTFWFEAYCLATDWKKHFE